MRRPGTGLVLGVVTLAALMAGCPEEEAALPGEDALFTVRSSYGCASVLDTGCALNRPLMTGIRETVRIALRPGDLPLVRSTRPSVLTVEGLRVISEGSLYIVDVLTGEPGAATLEVLRRGALVGRAELRVVPASRLDLLEVEGTRALSEDGASLVLTVGQRVSLVGQARDASGNALFAHDGVLWVAPADAPVRLSWGLQGPARVAVDRVYLTGIDPGEATVSLSAGDVRRSLHVTVLP